MSEHAEQSLVVQWAKLNERQYPELSCLFAIPNLGVKFQGDELRGFALMARLKAQGLQPGMPDLCLPVARGGYNALFIEMKRIKLRVTKTKGVMREATKPTPKQEEWHKKLTITGNLVLVCYTAEHAQQAITGYLDSKYLRMVG